jgi:hypothetical protein
MCNKVSGKPKYVQMRSFRDTSYNHVLDKLGSVLNKSTVVLPYYKNDMSAHSSTQLFFLKLDDSNCHCPVKLN